MGQVLSTTGYIYGQVYKITNLVSGKVYIGQTTKDLTTRLKQHYRTNPNGKLYKAIKSYGKKEFIIENIAIANSQEELDRLEILFIEKYNSILNGYNLTHGGRNYTITEEHRNNLRSAHAEQQIGIAQYDFDLNKISTYASISEASRTTGIKASHITCCINKKKGYKTAGNFIWTRVNEQPETLKKFYYNRDVVQIDIETNSIVANFMGASEANKLTKISRSHIVDCCKGLRKSAGGFAWKYAGSK